MIRHLATATTIAALVLTACGSDAPSTTEPPTTEPPTTVVRDVDVRLPNDPDAVVLQVDTGVNQPDPLSIASGYPIFTLYSDGRLIAEDRSVASGALAPLLVARIDEDGVRQLIELAIVRGALDPLESYGTVNIADADGTGFVVATADRRSDFGVYALGAEGHESDEITADQLAAREDLLRLRAQLLDWASTVGDHVVAAPQLFTGDSVLYVSDGELTQDVRADLAGGAFYDTRVSDVYCVDLTLADWPELVESVTSLERRTGRYVLRQVLPHEPGCAIIPEL